MKKRIKDFPKSSRPDEKIYSKGKENLSNYELLALLLGTGIKRYNALTLAKKLLKHHPLSNLANISSNELSKIPGVGRMKAARVLAALELGERIFKQNLLNKTIIKTTQDTLNELKEVTDKKQEQIIVLYLNSRHELIKKEVVAIGTLNSSLVEPRDILGPALALPCSSFLVAHNHPSGNPTPSKEDINFTQRLQRAGEILGISLIDHLIVTEADYFSFREHVSSPLKQPKLR